MVTRVETVVGRGRGMPVGAEDWMVCAVIAIGLITAVLVLVQEVVMKKYGEKLGEVSSLSRKETKVNKKLSNKKIRNSGKKLGKGDWK